MGQKEATEGGLQRRTKKGIEETLEKRQAARKAERQGKREKKRREKGHWIGPRVALLKENRAKDYVS